MRCCTTGWGGGGPCLTLFLAAAAVAVFMFPGAEEHLQYERGAIAAGELWRVLTCHLTHVTGEHLFWDLLPFVVLGVVLERSSRWRLAACLLVSALLVPAAVSRFAVDLAVYRGLSGPATGLLTLLAMELIAERRTFARLAGCLVVAALLGKIAFEFAAGASWIVSGGLVPVPVAHIAGAVAGLAVGLAWRGNSSEGTSTGSAGGRSLRCVR